MANPDFIADLTFCGIIYIFSLIREECVMERKEENGSAEPKPRYVWDPQKLAWVETTEVESEERVAEEVAVEPKGQDRLEKAAFKIEAEELSGEVPVRGVTFEVPGEAVGPQYRGAWIRLLGLIVDLVVLIVIVIIVGLLPGVGSIFFNSASVASASSVSAWQAWLYAGIFLAYFVGFWAWRGQTPGKMLIGAKIVKTDGRPIGIGRAVLRFVVYFLYLFLWGTGGSRFGILLAIVIGAMIIIAFNRRKKGIHDFIAGTVVISTRPKKPKPVEVESSEILETPETSESSDTSEPEAEKTETNNQS